MTGAPTVSKWARARFGDRAHQVSQGVAEAMLQAVNDAQNAQGISGSKTRYTFGGALLSRKHERLVDAFRDMEAVQFVPVPGSAFQFVVINGCLLLPFRYAHDATVPITEARISHRHVSARLQAIFAKLTRPTYQQEMLFTGDSDEESELAALSPALDQLPAGTRLVLVAFACNDQAGLLNLWWGEGELADEYGRLRWISRPEQLRLPAESGNARPWLITSEPDAETAARFDNGEMPGIATQLRPRGQAIGESEELPVSPEAATNEQR